ncbi:unnamed protein product, partial [Caenorhabditis brenneri]
EPRRQTFSQCLAENFIGLCHQPRTNWGNNAWRRSNRKPLFTGNLDTSKAVKMAAAAEIGLKKLNIIIRRGTLFDCVCERVVENGEHKFLVT